jgi:hypothetical protein
MIKYKVILSFLAVIAIVSLSDCKKKDPSPQDGIKSQLVGPIWKIKTVSVDGVDYTSSYTGMTIIFRETTYNTTNGGVVWPASGTWSFNSADGTKIIREDGKEVTVAVSSTQLDLLLFWPTSTFEGGRTSSVKGNHTFTFTK